MCCCGWKPHRGNDLGQHFPNLTGRKNHLHSMLKQIHEPQPQRFTCLAPKIPLEWSSKFCTSSQSQDNSMLSNCEVQFEYQCSRVGYQRLPENRQKSEAPRVCCSADGPWPGSFSVPWDLPEMANLRLGWIRTWVLLPSSAGDRHVH